MKQLLRYIKGTIHYKVQLKPKIERNHNGEIKVAILSLAQTQTGLDAVQPGRALVVLSRCVGEYRYYTSAAHSRRLP
eukprot:1281805-Amphidinium_carterae.1